MTGGDDDGDGGDDGPLQGGGWGTNASNNAISMTEPDYAPAQVDCSGQITAAFTWQPAYPGEQAPQCAILTQTSGASSGSTGDDSGQIDDGQGDSDSVSTISGGGKSVGRTMYSSQSSPGTPAQCGPSASGYAMRGTVIASASYTASLSPITIDLGSPAIQDSRGNWYILVGQLCSPRLVGIPPALRLSTTYQWSVSGTTFQTWQPTTPALPPYNANPNASYYVSGPGPLNISGPSWYWNDLSQATETITCTATVTPPAGQGAAFTVTASQQVTVMVPFVDAGAVGGLMRVVGLNDGNYYLKAVAATQDARGGMDWDAVVVTPSSPAFGGGQVELVQIVIPNESYVAFSTGATHSDPENSQVGLDTGYPYGRTAQDPNGGRVVPEANGEPAEYTYQDSPQLRVQSGTTPIASSAQMAHQFQDTLMYQPPNSTQWVPVAVWDWSTNGNATIPGTNSWSSYPTSAGTVSPGSGTFTPSNFFPLWAVVNLFPAF